MDKNGKTGAGNSGDATRAGRLKAALRENLRRRKAQARGRAGNVSESPPARPRGSGGPGAKNP
jgi:hypothetical protein